MLRFGRGLPSSFSCEGTFRVTIIPRSIPLSYGVRRHVHGYLCTNIHGVMPKNKGIFIIIIVRTSNNGVPNTLSFERQRPNEIWFKMKVFVGMLQEDSHLHDPATDLGPLRWGRNITNCDTACSSQRDPTFPKVPASLLVTMWNISTESLWNQANRDLYNYSALNSRKQSAECKLNKKQSALINGSPLVSRDFSNKFLSFLRKKQDNFILHFRRGGNRRGEGGTPLFCRRE